VAAPALQDPNFDHAVVLLLDHDEDGSLGVVLNRPSPVPVEDVLADWAGLATAPDVLFHGGPVGTDSVLAVGAVPEAGPADVAGDVAADVAADVAGSDGDPVGWRRLFGEHGLVDLDTPTELIGPVLRRLRIFAGYAGWGPDQLAAELAEGSWYVVPAEPGDVFTGDPGTLWRRVLRRQPGDLAWVSTRPTDPTLN
jgi:putative transcriptional regulator